MDGDDGAAGFGEAAKVGEVEVGGARGLQDGEEAVAGVGAWAVMAVAEAVGGGDAEADPDAVGGGVEGAREVGAVVGGGQRELGELVVPRGAFLDDLFLLEDDVGADVPAFVEAAVEAEFQQEGGLVVGVEVLLEGLDADLAVLVAGPEVGLGELGVDVVAEALLGGAAEAGGDGGEVEALLVAEEIVVGPGDAGAAAEVGGVGGGEGDRSRRGFDEGEGDGDAAVGAEGLAGGGLHGGEDGGAGEVFAGRVDLARIVELAGVEAQAAADEAHVDVVQAHQVDVADVDARAGGDVVGQVDGVGGRVFGGGGAGDGGEGVAAVLERVEQGGAGGEDGRGDRGLAGLEREALAGRRAGRRP